MTICLNTVDEAGKHRKLADMKQDFFSHFPSLEDIPHGVKVCFKGEPTANKALNLFLIQLAPYGIEPEVRTILPRGDENLWFCLNDIVNTVNEDYAGTRATLILDLVSTSEKMRRNAHGAVRTLAETSKAFAQFPAVRNDGKVVLSFRDGYPVDAGKLRQLFPPEQFAVEFTSPEPVLALVDYSALGQAGYFRYHSAILEDGEEDNQVVNE